MKNTELVSIILPVLNCARYIEESIRSVLSQDYKNFELIIVCGNSDDRTSEIVKSFENIMHVEQIEEGIAQAFNQGIKKASGKFIAFQSGDDIWMEGKISSQVEFMTTNPDYGYTTTNFRYFLDKESKLPSGFKKELINKDLSGPTLESFLCRKNLFKEIGNFDTSFSSALDIEWFSRLNDNCIPGYSLPEVFLHKRIHNNNISLNEISNNKQILNALRLSINKRKRNSIKN